MSRRYCAQQDRSLSRGSTSRKIRQSPPTKGEDRLIPFLASLVAEDLSPKTVK